MELVIDKKNIPLDGLGVAVSPTTGTVLMVIMGETRLPIGALELSPEQAQDIGRMLLSAATLPAAMRAQAQAKMNQGGVMTKTRTCRKCKEILPVESFYERPKMRDGRHSWCMACSRAAVTTTYAKKKAAQGAPATSTGPAPVPFYRIHDVWPLFPPIVGRDKAEPFPAEAAGNADAYSGLQRPHSKTKTKTFGDLLRSFA